MPNSRERSRYEEGLSRAHRSLYWAQQRAEDLGDQGAVEDLASIMAHLSVMMQDSLKSKRRPRHQLDLLADDRA